jgi:hypothetical protein
MPQLHGVSMNGFPTKDDSEPHCKGAQKDCIISFFRIIFHFSAEHFDGDPKPLSKI